MLRRGYWRPGCIHFWPGMAEAEAVPTLFRYALEYVLRPNRTMAPYSQTHSLTDQHQILKQKKNFIVGAKRISSTQWHNIIWIHESTCRTINSTDWLIRYLRSDAKMLAHPSFPIFPTTRSESLPVVHDERSLSFRLRQNDQKNIDVLACAIDDRQKNRRAGHI